MRRRPVGAQIVDAGQPLLEKPEQVGAGRALGGHLRHGEAAAAVEHRQRDQREQRDRQPDAPVLAEQQRDYAHHQQPIAQHQDHKLREEGRERGHVAVDSLDQLAGRMGLVKGHVEPQAVRDQVGAQRVGGGPADAMAHVGGGDGDQLLHQRNADEQQPGARKLGQRPACGGDVDE